ncbi:TNT domain-containing protein [Amycolatopsis sp. QT-25]|uniref:TNT domain-containing protein n=1 Tax=Amycolatopsis sp. QT-25 TaxID=3034022 RepID=UPI0023ED35EE|nr:TNT domain-containing protein [Amycolatopsis sp. QT-25]WET80510.1 TNT domain-containing protein [Amycolatopsis sp. QT-25]
MTDPSEAGTCPIRLPVQYDDTPTPPHGARAPYAPSPWPPAVAPLRVPFPPRPVAPPPMGALRTERESVLALFLVHMFPIGHLPIAMGKPARQLPLPDGGSGPQDHPEAGVLDDSAALSHVSSGFRRSSTTRAVAPPPALRRGHDPWGGMSEEDWTARFVGENGCLWPPAELFPEGGIDPATPTMLEAGTLVDRFGDQHGRVFAEDGTLFPMRSLPPEQICAYRRYHVVRPLPVWRSVTAEWFGQPGGGVRFRTVLGADELVTLGFLADVTGEVR